VLLYDEKSGGLEALTSLTSGGSGAPPDLEYPIKQVVRLQPDVLPAKAGSSKGLLAMVAGGPHRGQPPFSTPPEPALLLHSIDEGESWEVVPDFPANTECPNGVAPELWDDDGDREGRHLCALDDGRVVATWCVAGSTSDYRNGYKGIQYNISVDGFTWDKSKTVTVMAETMVLGRYYSPRTVQLDSETLGTVYVQGPQNPETEGVHFVKLPLMALDGGGGQ
jgi:hypothetical protein